MVSIVKIFHETLERKNHPVVTLLYLIELNYATLIYYEVAITRFIFLNTYIKLRKFRRELNGEDRFVGMSF